MKNKSRFLSYILRHDTQGLSMSKSGWVKVDDILNKLDINKLELDEIVSNNDKNRFSYDVTGTLIRANQGHSLPVSVDYKKINRPVDIYHGTSEAISGVIMKRGLSKMNRTHVHWSPDLKTAITVGKRHSDKISIFKLKSLEFIESGGSIYLSENGVYLTGDVDPKFLERIV